MNSSKYIFTLDLRSVQSQITLPVTQGDTNRTLLVSFSDGAKPYVLGENCVAMMSIVRPTGTKVQEVCIVEEGGACVIYHFSDHTCVVPGLHNCQMVLYNSEGKQIASPKFSIDASPRLVDGDEVVLPDDDVASVDEMFRNEAARQAAELKREAAENARETAEKQRESDTQAAIREVNVVKANIEHLRDSGGFDGISPTVRVVETSTGHQIIITDKNSDKTIDVKDGDKGVSAFHEWNGTILTMRSAAGTSSADLKGEKGDKGDRGDSMQIYRTFASVAEMLTNYETDDVPIGAFVLITTEDVDDPDNSRLYVKTDTTYHYLNDLSGAQGIHGVDGLTPFIGENGNWWIGKEDTGVRADGVNKDEVVPRMSLIDEVEENNVLEDYNDGKTFADTYNRVYVEMSGGRGVYGRYCLTAGTNAPLDPDPEDYANNKKIDSIPLRMDDGFVRVPTSEYGKTQPNIGDHKYSEEERAMSKKYIDTGIESRVEKKKNSDTLNRIYVEQSGGRGTNLIPYCNGPTATSDHIPQRTKDGLMRCSTPDDGADNICANKGYVDAKFKSVCVAQDVSTLPTENIDDKILYRLTSATFIHNRHPVDNSVCFIVDNRPEIGEPATSLNRDSITAYYDLSDGNVYGYLNADLANGFSVLAGTTISAGWYNAEDLLPIAGWNYAGVIDNIGDDPNDSTIRLLFETKIFIYSGKWIDLTNSVIDERLPAPDKENGHWAYTVQRREGEDQYELHLISHSINDLYDNQIPLRTRGVIKTATPKDELDCANKEYVDQRYSGSNKAVVYADYSSMVMALNSASVDAYAVGQNIYIETLDVPDLWISGVSETSTPYTYTNDSVFNLRLKNSGSVKVGYYTLSALETQKVDLSVYPTTEQLTSGSVIPKQATSAESATNSTYALYASSDTSKGTIEQRLNSMGFKEGSTIYKNQADGWVVDSNSTYYYKHGGNVWGRLTFVNLGNKSGTFYPGEDYDVGSAYKTGLLPSPNTFLGYGMMIVDGSEEGTSGYYMYLPVKMKRSNTKDSVTISVPAFADAFGLTAFSWSRVVGLDIHFAYRST